MVVLTTCNVNHLPLDYWGPKAGVPQPVAPEGAPFVPPVHTVSLTWLLADVGLTTSLAAWHIIHLQSICRFMSTFKGFKPTMNLAAVSFHSTLTTATMGAV